MNPATLRRVFNFWPPFLCCGIHVETIAADWRYARVRLKLRWYNRNYVRTHFGGNLFSMTDPFWMIMVMEALRHEYIVWDRSATIVSSHRASRTCSPNFVSTTRCSTNCAPRRRTAKNICAGSKPK